MAEQAATQAPFNKHEWIEKDFRWKDGDTSRGSLTCCRHCGIVRQRHGGNDDKPCKGKVYVTLR